MNQNERLNYLINYLLEDLHLDKDYFLVKISLQLIENLSTFVKQNLFLKNS
mgnify:FL=1